MDLFKCLKKFAGLAAAAAIVVGTVSPSWQVTALDNTDNISETESVSADVTPSSSLFDLSREKKGDGSSYISNASIEYQSGTDWISVANAKNIPADARLRITVDYEKIPSSSVRANNNTVTYTLPSLLYEPKVTSGIIQNENGEQIGTISADSDNRMISMVFNDSHLSGDTISGSFTFTASADRSTINQYPTQTVTIGPINIDLNFETDSVARLGDISISKAKPSYIAADSTSGYLEYTVTVTNGNEEMPDVVVADKLSDASWVFADSSEPYSGVTAAVKTLTDKSSDSTWTGPYETISDGKSHGTVSYTTEDLPDKTASSHAWLKWNIGTMAANETRTLTYRVKVNSNFVGLSADNAVGNTAVLYSKSYPHGNSAVTYKPDVAVSSQKTAGNVIDNGNNTISIPYTITVTAGSSNTWTLRNVKLNDRLSGQSGITAAVLQKYGVTYSDFKVDGKTGYTLKNYATGTSTSPYFDFYFGDLAPGQTKVITYKVTLNKAILTYQSGDISLTNSMRIFSDDSQGDNYHNRSMSSSSSSKSIGSKQWDRKMHGDKLATEKTQTVSGGTVYESLNGNWQKASDQSAQTVTIPAGSYQYQVVVNETGDWDVSSAMMQDALGDSNGSYLAYKGYLRLDYYSNGISSTASSDQAAVSELQQGTPTKTVWLWIDGMTSLSFIASQLDRSLGRGAYLLTYYASPVNVENVSKVVNANTFKLSGNVIGPGDTTPVTMEGISVNTSVVVDGAVNYSAQKYGWYFDNDPEKTVYKDDYSNGKLYWVIDVTGSKVPAGTTFIDEPSSSNIRGTSLAGVYIGTVPDGQLFTDYYAAMTDVNDDVQKKNLTVLDSNAYTVTKTNTELDLQLTKDLTLTGSQHMFIVIRTNPTSGWTTERETKTFSNKLSTKEGTNSEKIERNTATLLANWGGTNFKESVAMMAKDGSGWHNLSSSGTYQNDSYPMKGNGYSKVITNGSPAPTKNGIYLDWHIKINYAANESGTVTVTDQLPSGVEPVYVRYFWAKGEGLKITMPEITDGRVNDQDWTDIGLKDTMSDGKTATLKSAYAYYNASTNQIMFDVANLQKAPAGTDASAATDAYSLEVQIVVYVTDPQLNHGQVTTSKTSKEFSNAMSVTKNGQVLTKDTASMTVPSPKVGKTMNKYAKGSNQVSFSLNVNPYSADLAPGSDVITLIDDMDKSVSFDPDSIVVKDSSHNVITDIIASISDIVDSHGAVTGHRLSLILPDEKNLTITYNGVFTAKLGTTISVTNKAYWQGYEIDTPQIYKESVEYTVDSIGISSTAPKIQIVKYDADLLSKKLSKAVFQIQRAVYDESTRSWSADPSSASYTVTTADDGTAVFSTATTAQDFMEYDTVYMIYEKTAPPGYKLDQTKHLVEVAAYNKTTNTYSDRSADEAKGVTVNYHGSIYTMNLYNQKGVLPIVKKFQDMTGKELTKADIPDGTYSFGLYTSDSPSASKEPLQILDIVYQGGAYSYYLTYAGWGLKNVKEDTAQFVDLAIGSEYYVYELDASGKPVMNYDSSVPTTAFTAQNGLSFEASYSSDGVAITDAGNASVTIINRRHFEYEPVTGVKLTDDKLLSWALVLVVGIFLTGLLKRMGKDM